MAEHTAPSYWDERGLVILWMAILAGPTAWVAYQALGYVLVKPVCSGGGAVVIAAIALVTFGLAAAGAVAAWSMLQRLDRDAPDDESRRRRTHFLAVSGIALNALIAVLILTSAAAPFFLSPCE
jgi:hypothetical protein